MSVFKKCLTNGVWVPQLQLLRYKSKINITNPRPPHFIRDIFEHVCLPKVPREDPTPPYLPQIAQCDVKLPKPPPEVPPLTVILGREVLDYFNKSKLIALYHKNHMNEEDEFEHEVEVKRHGMKLLKFRRSIMKSGLTGTIYEPILHFYHSQTLCAVGPELDLQNLLKLSKKLPCLVLIGAVVFNNRLLDVREIQKYGEIGNLDMARCALLSTLNSASLNLVNQLNTHPNILVQQLNQIKDLKKT